MCRMDLEGSEELESEVEEEEEEEVEKEEKEEEPRGGRPPRSRTAAPAPPRRQAQPLPRAKATGTKAVDMRLGRKVKYNAGHFELKDTGHVVTKSDSFRFAQLRRRVRLDSADGAGGSRCLRVARAPAMLHRVLLIGDPA